MKFFVFLIFCVSLLTACQNDAVRETNTPRQAPLESEIEVSTLMHAWQSGVATDEIRNYCRPNQKKKYDLMAVREALRDRLLSTGAVMVEDVNEKIDRSELYVRGKMRRILGDTGCEGEEARSLKNQDILIQKEGLEGLLKLGK